MVSFSCCCSSNKEPEESNSKNITKCEEKALENFLSDEKTLEQLWLAFDPNKDKVIDEKEFENLVYKTLLHFISLRNPDFPAPEFEDIKPFTKDLVATLRPFVDDNKDNKITKDEFQGYGVYLTAEFNKWQDEAESKMNKEKEEELGNTEVNEKTKLLATVENKSAPSQAVEAA